MKADYTLGMLIATLFSCHSVPEQVHRYATLYENILGISSGHLSDPTTDRWDYSNILNEKKRGGLCYGLIHTYADAVLKEETHSYFQLLNQLTTQYTNNIFPLSSSDPQKKGNILGFLDTIALYQNPEKTALHELLPKYIPVSQEEIFYMEPFQSLVEHQPIYKTHLWTNISILPRLIQSLKANVEKLPIPYFITLSANNHIIHISFPRKQQLAIFDPNNLKIFQARGTADPLDLAFNPSTYVKEYNMDTEEPIKAIYSMLFYKEYEIDQLCPTEVKIYSLTDHIAQYKSQIKSFIQAIKFEDSEHLQKLLQQKEVRISELLKNEKRAFQASVVIFSLLEKGQTGQEAVQALLHHKDFDVNKKYRGGTLLDRAKKEKNQQLVQILQQYSQTKTDTCCIL